MPIGYGNHTEIIDTDANNSVTMTVPASLAADEGWLAYCVYDADAGGSIATPSGFTTIGSQYVGNSGYPICKLFWKVAGASESSATITCTGTDYDCVVYSIRLTKGAGESIELDATGTPTTPTGSSTTVDAPDITVGAASSLAVLFCANVGNGNTLTSPEGAPTDERTGAVYPNCAFAYTARGAGSYAPGNWSNTTSLTDWTAQTISFKPVAASTGSAKARNLPLLGVA